MLGYLFVLTLPAGIVGAIILAFREALRRAEREMVFVLGENGIVRQRQGFPDERIDFSEIDTLSEETRWFVINSIEPRRKIAIPNNVTGYEVIRAELAKHHVVSSRNYFRDWYFPYQRR